MQEIEDSPFSVTATALGCDGTDMGCGIADDYRLDVIVSGGAAPVYQGQTKLVHLGDAGANQTIQFRNLRSFETGWCDDYWNWGWWATPIVLED